jgi:hypothetical protein
LFDDFVDAGHKGDGLLQRGGDGALMLDSLGPVGAAFAVLEPLVADLVPADVERPHLGGDGGKVLRGVDEVGLGHLAILIIAEP